MQTFTYMWNCRYIQIVKEFLNDKLHSLVAGEDDIAKIGEEPHLCMAMRLVGHTYMPKWHTLAVPECKAWVLGHMDALLSARKAEFILAIAEWRKQAGRTKKKQGLADHRKEIKAMGELHSALTTDAEDVVENYKKDAIFFANQCQNVYFVEGSNAHPSVICNERIILKFLDYIWSPVGKRDKENLGKTVLCH
jgi:hypothetical protein